MLRTDTAVTIYRKDYTAPAFRIDEVALEIDLVPERTRVVNRMRMTRTDAGKPLVLAGEGLELAARRSTAKRCPACRPPTTRSPSKPYRPMLAPASRWNSPPTAIPQRTPR